MLAARTFDAQNLVFCESMILLTDGIGCFYAPNILRDQSTSKALALVADFENDEDDTKRVPDGCAKISGTIWRIWSLYTHDHSHWILCCLMQCDSNYVCVSQRPKPIKHHNQLNNHTLAKHLMWTSQDILKYLKDHCYIPNPRDGRDNTIKSVCACILSMINMHFKNQCTANRLCRWKESILPRVDNAWITLVLYYPGLNNHQSWATKPYALYEWRKCHLKYTFESIKMYIRNKAQNHNLPSKNRITKVVFIYQTKVSYSFRDWPVSTEGSLEVPSKSLNRPSSKTLGQSYSKCSTV